MKNQNTGKVLKDILLKKFPKTCFIVELSTLHFYGKMIINVFYIKIANMIYIVKITENKFTENAFYSEIASNMFYHLQTISKKTKTK